MAVRFFSIDLSLQYTRAVRAVKLDRMFAKPFIGAMDDHSDGVYCLAVNPVNLSSAVSGSADGETIVWDLANREKLWSVYGHAGFVRGVGVTPSGEYFFSCGDDKTIKQWRMASHEAMTLDEDEELELPTGGRIGGGQGRVNGQGGAKVQPVKIWTARHAVTSIDFQWTTDSSRFATSSTVVNIWDVARSDPIFSYEWGADTISCVRYNPAEKNVLASTGNDRSITLYDMRQETPLRKINMAMNSNTVAWNPREPMNFTVANEDYNLYTFDMRKLEAALQVHKDHVGAVMDVHYSPTGREFVSASYDRSIRIWRADSGKSREIYHAKRMQRVFAVRVTPDARFILSGSDDANVRIWKMRASESLGRQLPRERDSKDYMNSLKKKFAHMPEVQKIANHRHVPAHIKSARKNRHISEQSQKRKLANVRANSKPDSGEGIPEAERTKQIISVSK